MTDYATDEEKAWLAENPGKTYKDYWDHLSAVYDAKPFLEKYGADRHAALEALRRLAKEFPGLSKHEDYHHVLRAARREADRQLDDNMFNSHPMLFRTTLLGHCGVHNNYQRLRGLGTEAPEGWYNIIDEGCKRIEEAVKGTDVKPVWLCLKQKFGTMRPWLAYEDGAPRPTEEVAKVINDTIRWMEEESSRTCEVCGKPGRLDRSHAWVCTLCDEHAGENNDEDQG
jgi:hypothetical protein